MEGVGWWLAQEGSLSCLGPVFATSLQLKYLAVMYSRVFEHGTRLRQNYVGMLTRLDPRQLLVRHGCEVQLGYRALIRNAFQWR
jgi:hypothetical protein